MQLQLVFNGTEGSGFAPIFGVDTQSGFRPVAEIASPAAITLLSKRDPYDAAASKYAEVQTHANVSTCDAEVFVGERARIKFTDSYRLVDRESVLLEREVRVISSGDYQGVRSDLYLSTVREGGTSPYDLEYLAGSAFYRHLDPDGDGVPDTHSTFNVSWCEDKLTFPAVAAYDPSRGLSLALCRADLPKVDFDIKEEVKRGNRYFLQETDIGSLGFGPAPTVELQMALRAHFPGYEGPQSFSIDRSGSPWGRFREAADGSSFRVAYLIHIASCSSFVDASWGLYTYLLDYYESRPVELPYTFEEANRARIALVNSEYREWRRRNGNTGAAYILNSHPDEGTSLADVVEYGFTGRTLTNAYASLRSAKQFSDPQMRERAINVVDFFVRDVVQPNGFSYGVYSLDEDDFLCWWSGITLPCTFSRDEKELATHLSHEMAAELWPLAVEMREVKGNFTRSISEAAIGLMDCYMVEAADGENHRGWLEALGSMGEFFLRIQNHDGSWYRAVDSDGEPVRTPEHWFGRTEEMRKSGTYTVPVFLLRLYRLLHEHRYLESALRGADYLERTYGEKSYYYGSLLDAPHGRMVKGMGPIFDNTTPLVAMQMHLMLYEITADSSQLNAAVSAAKIACTWVNLWDVPMPDGSTLGKYRFRSTGFSAVDIAVSTFQSDMMPLYWVRDLLKIAEVTSDHTFFRIAKLIQFGENQMLSTDREKYGYALNGIQNEGRHLSWFLAREWTGSFGFGRRGKGEENKTHYGWVAAVPLAGYYRILDEYGTVDFDVIESRIFG